MWAFVLPPWAYVCPRELLSYGLLTYGLLSYTRFYPGPMPLPLSWLHVLFKGYRSDNFVVGLTNTDPAVSAPVLWKYTLCGQYPGAVPDAATVGVQCSNVYQQYLLFRYVIVQFPLVHDQMNFCEIEVLVIGMFLYLIRSLDLYFTNSTLAYLITNLYKSVHGSY